MSDAMIIGIIAGVVMAALWLGFDVWRSWRDHL